MSDIICTNCRGQNSAGCWLCNPELFPGTSDLSNDQRHHGHWCDFCQTHHSSVSCYHPGQARIRKLQAEAADIDRIHAATQHELSQAIERSHELEAEVARKDQLISEVATVRANQESRIRDLQAEVARISEINTRLVQIGVKKEKEAKDAEAKLQAIAHYSDPDFPEGDAIGEAKRAWQIIYILKSLAGVKP